MIQETEVINDRLPDGGPIYHETNLDNFIVEPWNAFSSLLFLIPVIYFLIILRGKYKEYPFVIFICSPLLFFGGIGSTLYHAFRDYQAFFYLDVLPIILLTLIVSIYFLYKIMPHWWYVVIILLLSFLLRYYAINGLPTQTGINLMYFITGTLIFVPAIIILIKTNLYQYIWLVLTVVFFAFALFFRYYDDVEKQFLETGTHWLWHLFCSAGSLTLGYYLIKIKIIKRHRLILSSLQIKRK